MADVVSLGSMSSATGDPKIDAALATDLTIDITTTGRTSGQPRRIEIWFVNVGGRIFITGTPGPRDWMSNLAANNRLIFHLKESVEADLPGRAELVTDRAIREMLFADDSTHWYREQTTVEDLVDNAPTVEIYFSD